MDTNQGFGAYIDKTLKKVTTVYLKHFKENDIDLTLEQWVLLERTFNLGSEASQSAIAKLNYRNRATTSRVITGLCNKGYLLKKRFNGDNKRFKLVLTPSGKALVKRNLPVVKKLRAVGYKDIKDEDFTIFLNVLDQLWNNYHAIDTN